MGGYLFQSISIVWCLETIATLITRHYEEKLAPFYHTELRK